MQTQESNQLPDPDRCGWCQDARTCTTKDFPAATLATPKPVKDELLSTYFENLCHCGQQMALVLPPDSYTPESIIPHTKLCKEHTIRWMQALIKLKERSSK